MHVNYVNKRTYSSVVVNIVVDNVVLGFLKLLLFFKQPGKSAFFRQSVLIRLHEILWSLVFLGELYICMNIYIYRNTLGPITKKSLPYRSTSHHADSVAFSPPISDFSQLILSNPISLSLSRGRSAPSQLDELKRELDEIKHKLGSQDQSAASVNPELLDKVLSLEEKNAELSTRLTQVSTSRQTTTEAVIGGLSVPNGASLKNLVLAVLKTVHTDIDTRDIISARMLISKAAVNAALNRAGSKGPANHSQEAPSTSTTPSVSPRQPRPPSIIVTLSSRALLLEVIKSKIQLGKLHTTAITPNLPTGIEPTSISPALININEFLPRKIFNLRRTVYQKAQLPNSGFVTFVRNGSIYVRRKKGDVPTIITSEQDLDRFLA